MPHLDERPLLADLQSYVSKLEDERGFADQTVLDKCLLLGEEVGELFKAIRRTEGLLIDQRSEFGDVASELADILIYLCAIANRYDIDLERAFREKETENHTRTWTSSDGD